MRRRRFRHFVLLLATACSDGGGIVDPVVEGRSTVDRPDQLTGPQVHVVYVIPRGGTDRQLDVNGTLANSVGSLHNWFTQHSGGLRIRFDMYQDALDITFFELSSTNAEMLSLDPQIVKEIERQLRAADKVTTDKIYMVYYDGGSTYACGGAAWPPSQPGQVSAMYLTGTPPGASCGAQPFVASPTQFPQYWEFAALHDLMHDLGIVDANAPNHTSQYPAHVPETNDLMYSGSAPWVINSTTVIDVGGDDYLGANVPDGVANLAFSPYVFSGVAAVASLEPLTSRAAAGLAGAVAHLPPHAPLSSLQR